MIDTIIKESAAAVIAEPSCAPLQSVFLDLFSPLQVTPQFPQNSGIVVSLDQSDEAVCLTVVGEETPLAKKQKLSDEESVALERCEKVIRTTKESAFKFAIALNEIRQGKLYRGKYTTFAEYCLKEHGLSRSYAYRKAAWGREVVAEEVEKSPMGDFLPTNERQARAAIQQRKNATKPTEQPVPAIDIADEADSDSESDPVTAAVVEMPTFSTTPVKAQCPVDFKEAAQMALKASNLLSSNSGRQDCINLLGKLTTLLNKAIKWQEELNKEAA